MEFRLSALRRDRARVLCRATCDLVAEVHFVGPGWASGRAGQLSQPMAAERLKSSAEGSGEEPGGRTTRWGFWGRGPSFGPTRADPTLGPLPPPALSLGHSLKVLRLALGLAGLAQ